MPIVIGGAGGGSSRAFRLGPETNEFTGADKAAAEGARNTYATANAEWLADYNANDNFFIELTYGTTRDYQARNAAGTGWEDVTALIRGEMGLMGAQGRFYLSIHINSASQPTPSTPTGGSYVLSTGVFTPPTGTTEDPTPPAAGEDIWLSQAEIDPENQTGAVIPVWSEWVERSHLSAGISHVEIVAGDLTGNGLAATPLGLDDARKFEANPTGAAIIPLETIDLGGTLYTVDEVVDVTDFGLPVIDINNYRRIFADHDTPRGWLGHRVPVPGTPASGTFNDYSNANFLGVRTDDPSNDPTTQQYYYNRTSHVWRGYGRTGGFPRRPIWINRSFGSLFGSSARWLGEQPDDDTAANLVQGYSNSLHWFYYNTTVRNIQELNGSTYVAPIDPSFHYAAEPFSTPTGVGTIAGVTAGVGLTGGGDSGVVSLSIDITATDFPTIPLVKGGTGATTAAGARTALGLGSAAVLNAGIAAGNLLTLGTGGRIDTARLAASGAQDQFLSWTASGAVWANTADHYADNVALAVSGNDLSITIGRTGTLQPLTNTVTLPAPAASGVQSVTSGDGIVDTGTATDPVLGMSVAEASFPTIPINKGGTNAITAAAARTNLGLGTAAVLDSGITAGDVLVLDAGGLIFPARLAAAGTAGQVLERTATAMQWATVSTSDEYANSVALGISGNDLRITIGRTGALSDLTDSVTLPTGGGTGDITAVTAGTGLAGGGDTGAVTVNIAAGGVTEPLLAMSNAPSDGQVIKWDNTNSQLIWADDETTGGGTSDGVVNSATFSLSGSDLTLSLGRTNGLNAVMSNSITLPSGGGSGDITGVTAGVGLTGGGDSGAVTIDIDVTETDFPTIPLAKGGTGATTQAAAQTALGVGNALDSATWEGSEKRIAFTRVNGVTVRPVLTGMTRYHGNDAWLGTEYFLFADTVTRDSIFYQYYGANELGLLEGGLAAAANFLHLPILDASNELASTFLASAGTDGQVLTRTATGQAWEDQTGGTPYTDADWDARFVDRATNLTRGGVNFADRFLYVDDANPGVLGATQTGDIRGYTTSQWAQPGNTDAIPVDKYGDGTITEAKLSISNTPADTQVLSWDNTNSTLRWKDDETTSGGMADGVVDSLTTTVAGSNLTITLGRTNGLADLAQTVALPAGGGTGDITGITTAANSGLQGGVDSGAATLSLNIGGLAPHTEANIEGNDSFYLFDDSGTANVRATLTAYAGFLVAGAHALVDSGGQIDIQAASIITADLADGQITEPKLSVSNAPATDQLLSWSGSALTWVDATGGGGGDSLIIPVTAAQLTGDFDDLIITTGNAITLSDGMRFLVRMPNLAGTPTNAGAVTITVDSNPTLALAKSSLGLGSQSVLQGGEIRELGFYEFIYVDARGLGDNRFQLAPTAFGTAAGYDVGTGSGDIATLGTGGVFATTLLASAGTDGEILTRTASGMAWENMDIATDATVSGDGTAADPLGVADNAITEPRLNVSNPPSTQQVLGWNGTALEWTDQRTDVPGGGGEFDRDILTDYQDLAFANRPEDDAYVDFTLSRAPRRGAKVEVTMRINMTQFDTDTELTPNVGSNIVVSTGGVFSTPGYVDAPRALGTRFTVGDYTGYSIGTPGSPQMFNGPPAPGIPSTPNFTVFQGPLYTYSVCDEIDGDEWLDLPVLPARWGDEAGYQRTSAGSVAFSLSSRINRGSTQLSNFGHSVFYIARKSDTTFSIACPNWHAFWPNADPPTQGRFQVAFQIREIAPEASGGSGTNTNDYVNTLDANVSGNQLFLTLGRTGTLADLDASVTLIPDGGIGTAQLANNSVTGAKMGPGSVGSAQITASAVTTSEIANNAVTTAKVADGTITEPKLAITTDPTDAQVLAWSSGALTWVDQSGGASQRIFSIDAAGLTGTSDALVITTGQSITLADGMRFVFRPPFGQAANTAGVTVTVDSNPTLQLAKSNAGVGRSTLLTGGEIGEGRFLEITYLDARGNGSNRFGLSGVIIGTAAGYEAGVTVNDVPVLGTGGILPVSTLASAGTTGDVLTRTDTAQVWQTPIVGNALLAERQIGTYRFFSNIEAGQTDELFLTGITYPNATTTYRFHFLSNGRIESFIVNGGSLPLLTQVTAPVHTTGVTGTTVSVGTNAVEVGIGGTGSVYFGSDTTGVLAFGANFSGTRPTITLYAIEEGAGTGAVATDATIGGDGTAADPLSIATTTGTGRYYVVPEASVGGTATAVTLTTGRNITLQHGDRFAFPYVLDTSTGAITVTVDGNLAQTLHKANGQAGSEDIEAGDITPRDPLLISYSDTTSRFSLDGLRIGNASFRNVGTDEHDVPVLGTGGVLATTLLAPTGTDNQVLTRTATGMAWEDSTGDITGVTAGTGLSGGGDSGTVTLNIADNGVGSTQLANLSVGTAQLASLAVTRAKLATNIGGTTYQGNNVTYTGGTISMGLVGNATDLQDADVVSFSPPSTLPTDATLISVQINGGDTNQLWNPTGSVVQARHISQTARYHAQRSGNRYYLLSDPLALQVVSLNGGTLLGDGRESSGLQVADGGIGVGQIADGVITEPKLNISNAPATDQILSWSGSALAWIDAPAGGAGDITAVNAGSGLSGGGTSGAVSLALDIAGLGSDTGIATTSTFAWAGTAGTRNTNLGIIRNWLNSNLSIPEGSLDISNAPTANQLLSWTGTALAWADAGAGTGDITGITTTATGGLQGGVDSGVADLSLNIIGVPIQASADDNDFILIYDNGQSRAERLSVGSLAGFFAEGESTTASSGGKIRVADGGITATQIADDTITEPKLDVSNAPATGQLLSWDGSDLTWITAAGTGDITGVAAGTGLSGGGTSGDVTLNVADGGIGTTQLADDSVTAAKLANNSVGSAAITTNAVTTAEIADNAVTASKLGNNSVVNATIADNSITEPKLNINNTPVADQLLSWDGTELTWTDAGGGTGDITAVTAGVGLSGGGDSGAVTLNLDISGLTSINGVDVQTGDRIAIYDITAGAMRRLSFAQLPEAVFAANNTATTTLANGDRFQIELSSLAAARYVTFENLRGLIVEDVAINVADPSANTRLRGASRQSIAESLAATAQLAGATFTGAAAGIDPTADQEFVTLAYFNSNPADAGGGSGDHNRYFALGADRTFVESDYTGGLEFTSDTFQVPMFTDNSFWSIAVPATNPITTIIALTNPQQDLTSQFINEANVDIGGTAHQIWTTDTAFFGGPGQPMLRIS